MRKRHGKSQNRLCWCGSGKKYSDCHKNRENENPVTLQEIVDTFKKNFGKEYCLYPEASQSTCSAQIAKAHTVQKNGSLSKIARKSHVYGFKHRWGKLEQEGLPTAELIGIGKASTFTGFCSYHDNLLFEPIEKQPFQNSLQQIFLLGYKAISREYFYKKAQFDLIPFMLELDKGKSKQEQLYVQDFTQTYGTGIILGLNDLKHHKNMYDQALLTSDFSNVHYYTIFLENTPDLMCSGAVQVEYDFNGVVLQDLATVEISEYTTFSLVSTNSGGVAVFSWLGENPICLSLIKSLHSLSDIEIPHAILRFCLDSFENVYVSPNWWESLSIEHQKYLLKRVSYRTEPWADINPQSLKDDGTKIVEWKVVSRDTNCSVL